MNHDVTCVIPARVDSKRLHRKLLLEETGKPLIQHTIEQVQKSKTVKRIIVATDSIEISSVATNCGVEYAYTSSNHRNGTDRIAAAILSIPMSPDFAYILNVQADEPEISPEAIDELVAQTVRSNWKVGTGYSRVDEWEHLFDPSKVKLTTDSTDRCLYFSRSTIPHLKSHIIEGRSPLVLNYFKRHIGIYCYSFDSLVFYHRSVGDEGFGPLTLSEDLEQLHFLELGIPINAVDLSQFDLKPGIDTRGDYDRFVASNSCEEKRDPVSRKIDPGSSASTQQTLVVDFEDLRSADEAE